MNALIVLLGIIAAALAVPAHFPRGKVITYKYTADVKAGVIEPSEFNSQFGFECHLHVKHDTSDPTLKNAYYVTLSDVQHGMHNGHMVQHEHVSVVHPIPEAAMDLHKPFLIVYDEVGRFQGVKLLKSESGWSKNIKKGIASTLQLDVSNIHVQTPMRAHSFITEENTIHGTCQVAYNVHAVDQEHPESSNVFVVTKIHEPMNCTHFTHQTFNQVEFEECHVEEQEDMTTASRRVFEIENQGNEILIKKLVGHGVINYLPFLSQSEAHYLLTNQTLVLVNVASVTEVSLPTASFQDIPIDHNITYEEPKQQYVHQADTDVTHGRHVVKLNELVVKLKKMLDEAASYVKETHLEKKQPDWKHGQTINRLLHIMSYMNADTLKEVYKELENAKDAKEVTMRNIFLGVVPNVGTTAACLFTKDVVVSKKVPAAKAKAMLAHLPMHVKTPTKDLLLQMEQLLHLGDDVDSDIKEAAIFCFATLIHKTYEGRSSDIIDTLRDKYLQHFMDHVRKQPTLHMKIVYLMALKNVKLHQVIKVLEPVIKGEESISEKPQTIRMIAAWVIKPVIADHPHYAHDLYWPILTDVTLPTPIRITAYDILMNQLPHIGRLMNIHWLMVYEKDEHLYNYHVESIKGLAKSTNPCLTPVKEMASKVLSFTKKRHVIGTLSSRFRVDYMDEKYGFGEAIRGTLMVDRLTGLPHIGSVEHIETVARRPILGIGVHWNIDGLSEVMKDVRHHAWGKAVDAIKNDNVKDVLVKAAQDMPPIKEVAIDVTITMNDNVVMMLHANKNTWKLLLEEVKNWKKFVTESMNNINWQNILYSNNFEMHVPTDLGVPTVLASKVPKFDSFKGSVTFSEDKNLLGFKVKVKHQSWMHAEYVMSIYNPIVDVWHSVRRASSQDIIAPVEMNIGYNHDTKGLKVTIPRLPVSEFSVAGMATYAKTYVTITGDETDQLQKSCPTCRHHEMVTGPVNPKHYENIVDSKDTGLRFTMAVYDCEGTVTPVSPVVEWFKVLSDPHKNTMGHHWVHLIMAARQQIIRNMISGQEGSCTTLVKAEPSIVHPTSMVDLTGKVSIQDLDDTHDKLDMFSNKRIDVRGNVNVKAAATEESVRQWDMNVNVMLSQGHVNNTMKVMITRTTPGEKNLKICVDAQKQYPPVTSDVFNVNVGKKETNWKMTVTMGQTRDDRCSRDDMDVTVTVNGEVSEDQKKRIAQDSVNSMCARHKLYPLFHTDGSHVPKTWACIEDAVHHSTLRKYTANMALRKVPVPLALTVNTMQDVVRSIFFHHMVFSWDHVEPGNAKVVLEYPYLTPVLDTTVVTPTHSYELVQLPFGHSAWNMWMDNTHYGVTILNEYVAGHIMPCTIYPQVLLTTDNGTIPFIVPDKWTLLSGDHIDQTYAVFVKLVQSNRLAMKVYVGGHELTIMPTDTAMTVTVNNKVIHNYANGVMVPENEPDSYAIKMTNTYLHVTIESQWVPVRIFYIPQSVHVVLDTSLQGQVTGLCGHMDGTHKVELPKIYTVPHL